MESPSGEEQNATSSQTLDSKDSEPEAHSTDATRGLIKLHNDIATVTQSVLDKKGVMEELESQLANIGKPIERTRRSRKKAERFEAGGENDRRDAYVHHDETGCLALPDGRKIDLCDCLRDECLGCHFECVRCGSQKCSALNCRQNRPYFISSVVSDGHPEFNKKNVYALPTNGTR